MNWTTDKPTEAGWTATVRDKARKLYGLLHAEVSRDQVCGPEDVKAIRKMEIVDIGLLIAALDDSYQQGRAAGLREAVPLACKYCNDRTKWTPMSNSGYHVCNTPEPGFVRCQAIKIHAALAQQAQGEKGGVGDGN